MNLHARVKQMMLATYKLSLARTFDKSISADTFINLVLFQGMLLGGGE